MSYRHLVDQDRAEVARTLRKKHKYFYHGTSSESAKSIKQSGVDPACEGEDSRYFGREEPAAMRFSTAKAIALSVSAAQSRCQQWSAKVGARVMADVPVLLRVPSAIVLDGLFDLDHSYSPMQDEFLCLRHANRVPLTASDFLELIAQHGSLGCYHTISPTHIDYSSELSVEGKFRPLSEFDTEQSR
jgi:hypothetical protein